MKLITPVVLMALGTALCADNAAARGVSEKKTTVAQASGSSHSRSQGRCWHRSRSGQLFVWSGGRWVPTAGDEANSQSAAGQAVPSVRTGDYSPAGPNPSASYPDHLKPDVINGLDWYLNGRSYFNER
jgi:hypothetical protein